MNEATRLVLLGMVILWFGLCSWLFRRLERLHPEQYEALGRPPLVLRNNLENNGRFLRFLWSGQYAHLQVPLLGKVCRFMKVFFFVYLALFLLLATGMFGAFAG